jgi:hypothetical protein
MLIDLSQNRHQSFQVTITAEDDRGVIDGLADMVSCLINLTQGIDGNFYFILAWQRILQSRYVKLSGSLKIQWPTSSVLAPCVEFPSFWVTLNLLRRVPAYVF